MGDTKWSDENGIESLATTSLNSLADDGLVVSSEDDNGTDKNLYGDFELYVSGFGASIDQDQEVAQMFIVSDIDGTNYPDGGGGSVDPDLQHLVGSFIKETANGTGAVRMHIYGVTLPPRNFKAVLKNVAGQSWAATSNTLKINKFHITSA